jgi:hypothetical protein
MATKLEIGMALKTVLEKLEDVAEPFREHYVEIKDAKGKVEYVLGLEGSIDPLPQVKTLKQENGGFRIKLRDMETKYGKFDAFKDMDPVEVLAKLDRIAELEAAAGGKLDEAAIEKIVEGRIKTKLSPVERQLATVTAERDGFKAKNEEFTMKEKQRLIADQVRSAALKVKMEPTAVEDAIMLAERIMEVDDNGNVTVKDKVGYTPGIDVSSWLGDMQSKRPHWWGPSAGGGSRGNGGGAGAGGGANPWAHDTWNVTEQNKIYTSDQKRATQMAINAGTTLGGKKPAKK